MSTRYPNEQLLTIPQGIFTVSCAFILEGVKEGLGRHNEAIEDDTAEVNALKVGNLQPEDQFMANAYSVSVASLGDRDLCPRHDVHQAEHWCLSPATVGQTGVHMDHLDQFGHHHHLEHRHLLLEHVPMQSRRETMGL